MSVDLNLIRKYNVAGPRYTSYPTVPYWKNQPATDQWIASIDQALNESLKKQKGAALYIHIPFCESLCTFCGCTKKITKNHEHGLPYVQNVLKEWGIYCDRLSEHVPIPLSEVHLGGGTPTWLNVGELEQLIHGIFKFAKRMPDLELSFEADPRVTSLEQLEALAKLGFKRISFGIQDFDPRVQDIINRRQSYEQVRDLTRNARELGYESVNYDLIYGLPMQTLESIQFTIQEVIKLRPDRIAFYGYAHVPWIKPSQRRYTEADLPSAEVRLKLYETGRRMLEQSGYHEIGMDHFALETDGLYRSSQAGQLHRNFMGYMPKEVHPMIGLGMSAIGDSWRIFAQNVKGLDEYEALIGKNELPIERGHVLDEEDLILRRHILNLMTKGQTHWNDVELQTPFLESIEQFLVEPIRDKLVELKSNRILITNKGKPFLRNICMAFDSRLMKQVPTTKIFSQTI
jgi:oxygen-independent coproporphyrinogen-3 oxidase